MNRKKTFHKLALRKQTVSRLSDVELNGVKGGAVEVTTACVLIPFDPIPKPTVAEKPRPVPWKTVDIGTQQVISVTIVV